MLFGCSWMDLIWWLLCRVRCCLVVVAENFGFDGWFDLAVILRIGFVVGCVFLGFGFWLWRSGGFGLLSVRIWCVMLVGGVTVAGCGLDLFVIVR